MSTNEELKAEIHRLSQSVEEMQGRLAELAAGTEAPTDATPRSSRRRFLTLGAGAALGALGVAAGKVLPAAAANGATVTTGATATGEASTFVADDSVGPAVPAVPVLGAKARSFSSAHQTAAGTFAGALQGLGADGGTGLSAVAADGVNGWAEGDLSFGVYGLSPSGVGTVGESSTGIGLYSRGSGRILQDPQLAGVPAFAGGDFEIVRDANGLMWISMPGGTWKQVATTDQGVHLFPNPRRVWDGFVQPQGPGLYGPVDATTQISTSGGPGGPSGVPAGAQAAWCAVMSYSAGVMTVYPDGTPDTKIGNWSSVVNGQLNMLYMFVPLSTQGKFRFHAYFTGAKFFDVWGYLL
jgi:hypothetical protein